MAGLNSYAGSVGRRVAVRTQGRKRLPNGGATAIDDGIDLRFVQEDVGYIGALTEPTYWLRIHVGDG